MKDENGDATKNLKVWRTLDDNAGEEGQRAVVGQFVQRSQTGWNLQYTEDEKYCARVVTNQVQFYESGDLKTVWNKLIAEGVTDFAVSPGEKHSVAIFVPERKVRYFDFASETPTNNNLGHASCRQGIRRPRIFRKPSFAKDFLQGRQGYFQVEQPWLKLDRSCSDRRGQVQQELLWRDNYAHS